MAQVGGQRSHAGNPSALIVHTAFLPELFSAYIWQLHLTWETWELGRAGPGVSHQASPALEICGMWATLCLDPAQPHASGCPVALRVITATLVVATEPQGACSGPGNVPGTPQQSLCHCLLQSS